MPTKCPCPSGLGFIGIRGLGAQASIFGQTRVPCFVSGGAH